MTENIFLNMLPKDRDDLARWVLALKIAERVLEPSFEENAFAYNDRVIAKMKEILGEEEEKK